MEEFADLILYVIRYDTVPQNRIREGLSSLSGRRASFAGYVFNNCPETGESTATADTATGMESMATENMVMENISRNRKREKLYDRPALSYRAGI